MARMSTAGALMESLIRQGIAALFGVPGTHNEPFLRRGAARRRPRPQDACAP